MAAIFFVAGQTSAGDLPGGLSNYTGHFIAYGGLAALALRGFAAASWRGVTGRSAVLAVLLSAGYGVTDELHQRFVPNRFPGVDDWAFDLLGSILGVCAVLLLARLVRAARERTRDV